MKTKTKAFLISGIAMIVVNFTIETLYPMIYNEYLNSIEKNVYRLELMAR